jgi:mRNA interferase HigB
MRFIALSRLKAFWEEHPQYMDVKEPTLAWYRHALAADWSAPADVNTTSEMPASSKVDKWV